MPAAPGPLPIARWTLSPLSSVKSSARMKAEGVAPASRMKPTSVTVLTASPAAAGLGAPSPTEAAEGSFMSLPSTESVPVTMASVSKLMASRPNMLPRKARCCGVAMPPNNSSKT